MPAAVAEIRRIRAEWAALKNSDQLNSSNPRRRRSSKIPSKKPEQQTKDAGTRRTRNTMVSSSDALCGVVALVSVGVESRALALRAALSALGATVVPAWSQLVTHLVWAEGGCRGTRARARCLAARLVSPLWVEACAAAGRRLPERAFPAAARASDLPSPRTLRLMLKRAEQEDLALLLDSQDSKKKGGKDKQSRLRVSSETDKDTSAESADKSTDQSTDASANTSRDVTDVASRVNTAPRRVLPVSMSPTPPPRKSRRKLFTQKEVEEDSLSDTDEEEAEASGGARKPLTQRERTGLARAERLARKLLATCTPPRRPAPPRIAADPRPRIVLTGMSREERRRVAQACRALGGKLQRRVTRNTTHVVLGACGRHALDTRRHHSGLSPSGVPSDGQELRTLSSLAGAARGCHVLRAQWALDCFDQACWLTHRGYEVPHLKNLAQKAFVERRAFALMRSEYAYDVFNGKRIKLAASAEKRTAAIELLALCGAVVLDQHDAVIRNEELLQNGRRKQDGGNPPADCYLTIGTGAGEVSSRWVFDSVASGRMRNVRKYIQPGG